MAAKFAVLLDGTVLDADAINAVTALTVELNSAEASTASVTFSVTKDKSGVWSLLDDTRFAPFAKLGVRLGFGSGAGALGSALGGGGAPGGLTHVFEGYVTGVETQFGGGSSATLTVSGSDSCVLLNSEEKVASWPNQPDSAIVSAILAKYAIVPRTTATKTAHAQTVTTTVQRGSDLAFVRRLARRNGFEFYVEPGDDGMTTSGYFRPPQLDGTPQKTLAIQFGKDSNLRSFATRLNARKPQAVKTAQLDVASGETMSASVTSSAYTKLGASDDASLIGAALSMAVTPSEAAGQMLVLGAPSAEETELNALAQAVRDEAAWFISATGEVNAEAYGSILRPHRTVLVKGAGKPYSGAYYVVRVTHHIGGGGPYTMKFEALRNARDVKGDEAFAGAAGGLALAGLA